jgi:glutathione S-transferase
MNAPTAESRAIARYLAEKYQDQGVPLLGKTLKERAIINQWCEVESQNFNVAAASLIREMYMSSLEKRPINEEYLDGCKTKLEAILDVYEVHLSTNKFIAGNTYSLADALHIPLLNRLLNKKNEVFTGRKHVLAWAEALNSRPSYTKTQELNSKWANLRAV